MQQETNIINDDWTRNWQARVAIKITAIFLWVIILSGFGAVIYFTQDLDRQIEDETSRDLNAMAFQVQEYLAVSELNASTVQIDALRHIVEKAFLYKTTNFVQHSGISGVRITIEDEVTEVGEFPAGFSSSTRLLSYAGSDAETQGLKIAQLEAFFPKTVTNAALTRQHLVISVVIILLIFGMLLSFTIQQVLSKPFSVLMDAIQAVSNGDLNIRLDVSREDEFGHLSRFFNQMLDRVRNQQQELTEANLELTNEINIRKQAEQRLRANHDELEKLVDERTRDLAVARDQALAASQTKSAFIANISHEIRTPLTPIIGFAEALLQGTESEQNREQLLRTIIRNGKHLSQIINEILDLSKIEANSLDVESIPVDYFAAVSDVASVAEILVQEKGLVFEIQHQFPLPGSIVSDPTRIKQILMNLVTNAVKFTEKGKVSIATRYLADTRQVELAVVDTGIGIKKDKISNLFKPFSQADCSTTRQFGGTGLGLYISKRLANLLGGDIKLESVEGVGTRCVVTLSVGAIDPPRMVYSVPSTREDELGNLKQLDDMCLSGKVLLAEDSADIQRLMTYILSKTGVDVTAVENGELAVKAALGAEFRLILMDMQMPVMSGMEAVEQLRASGCATPIVALTANAMKEDRQRYSEIGCDGFLSKPVDRDKLHKVLRQYLECDKPDDKPAHDSANDHDEAFKALVSSFLDGLEDYATRISVALAEQKFDVVRELAHQLKGMGGSFGYPQITERAAELEITIKNGDHDEATTVGELFVDLLRETGGLMLDLETG